MCKDRKNKDKINANRVHYVEISQEFYISIQAVYNAANYVTNSDLAQRIRMRIKSKLIEEASKIVFDISEEKSISKN